MSTAIPMFRNDLTEPTEPALEYGCWYTNLGRVIVRERGAHDETIFDVTAYPLIAPSGERPYCVRSSDGTRVTLTQWDAVVGFKPAEKYEQMVKLDDEDGGLIFNVE